MEGPKLEWMYRNSSEIVDKEEYLLGKPIDKAFEQSQTSLANEIEKDCLPTSIFANSESNIQVDVVRKLKEDPLEIIRQQEIDRRKQLLKNPVKLKKLQNMLKESQGSKPKSKGNDKKSKVEDEATDIDKLLTSKYLKIMKKHGIKSLSELSNLKVDKKKASKKLKSSSDEGSSSSSESKSDEEDRRKYKEDSNKKRYKQAHTSYESSDRDKKSYSYSNKEASEGDKKRFKDKYHMSRSRNPYHRPSSGKDSRSDKKKINEREDRRENYKKIDSRSDHKDYRSNKYKKQNLSDFDKQKKLEEMMANAKWRDEVRTKNIERYKKEEASEKPQQYSENFMREQMILATNHESVESRIKSNINYIQKSKFSMNENFVRR